jgi:predicted helicase
MATFKNFLNSFDQKNKGKEFERFVKWFLKNDPEWSTQVNQVWLWDDYPERWGRDCGIDLVFKHKNNDIWAVQAKCYSPENPITKKDVDTFLNESDRKGIDKRLLIASTDQIGSNARQVMDAKVERPVTCFLYSDFDTSAIDYPDHISELNTAKRKKRPTPKPHQLEAIDAVEKGFKEADRGQLIMACGTGKTFTQLWVKERLSAKLTLVLVPSLSLLSQTLREWTFAADTSFDVLCVCSDQSVVKRTQEDATIHSVKELPFPVTSKVKEIESFLKGDGHKVIFSTYQSSSLIAESQRNNDVPLFDLVVADEAHRCTGKVDSEFTTILDNQKIKAKRRLFATATPRTYSGSLKKKAEEKGVEVASMDDAEVFGREFYTLNFGKAIELGELTDYQVIIAGVDNVMVAEWIKNRELVETDSGYSTNAESLAAQIGLIKIIKKYDLKRMISFHSRIKRAEMFASDIQNAIEFVDEEYRPSGSIWTDFVSGEMNAHKRRIKLEQLKELTKGTRALLSNAQCLSEGVDVPSLDGVAFIDPRKSQVDIVQAVGRAIRQSDEKKVGTIVLPVFLEDGETAAESIEKSNFKPVWDVLMALKSHDDVLSFELDELRTNLGKRKGPTRGRKKPKKITFDLPSSVDQNFSNALTTHLVERTTASWHFWFGLLETFVEREGHARMPRKFKTEDGYNLGSWVSTQRSNKKKNKLTPEKIKSLEELEGWSWSVKK